MLSSLATVLFDGFAYGMLLFLLSVGLSVTLGMMNFVNLAHCSFAAVGGYCTVTLVKSFGWPFLASLPMAFIAAGSSASFSSERSTGSCTAPPTSTSACSPSASCSSRWRHSPGSTPASNSRRARRSGCAAPSRVGGANFAGYRLFLIVFGLAVTAILVLLLEKTRFGARVRAAVDNQRMARGLGIDVDRAFMLTFALGGGLAGLGGALAIEVVGLDPTFALAYLVYVLIVVAVGGLGSIGGSFAAAVVLGISDMAGKYYFPWLGAFLIYLVMVALLMWRPAGLFGKR